MGYLSLNLVWIPSFVSLKPGINHGHVQNTEASPSSLCRNSKFSGTCSVFEDFS